MITNEKIIRLQDSLIKNYKKEIDLLKEQNALVKEENTLLREIVETQKKYIDFLRK